MRFIIAFLALASAAGAQVAIEQGRYVFHGVYSPMPLTFANLPTQVQNESLVQCTNCAMTNPCTAGGGGALAIRQNGTWNCATVSGGPGGPTGANTQVIFNDAGAFGADTGFTYNKTTHTASMQKGSLLVANSTTECQPDQNNCPMLIACNQGDPLPPDESHMKLYCVNTPSGVQARVLIAGQTPGNIGGNPTIGSITVAHNGVPIGTEPIINFLDTQGLVTWNIVDSSAAQTILISAVVVGQTTTTVVTTTTTVTTTTATTTTSTTTTTLLAAILPESVGVRGASTGSTNQLNCVRWTAHQNYNGNTKIEASITTAVAASHCGVALYASDGTQLAEADGACTATGTSALTRTGISGFNIVADSDYFSCSCTDTAAVQLLQIDDTATGTGHLLDLLNALPQQAPSGAQIWSGFRNSGCTGGVPPSPMGSLTAGNSYRGVMLEVSP